LRDLDQNAKRPDYNIGTDEFHTPFELMETARVFFEKRHLDAVIDKPYSGTIVPLKHNKKDKRVKAIMLEVNRRLYLEPGTNIRSVNYNKVKETVSEFIAQLAQNCSRFV
jgi:N-formylglutamate deformylase